MFFSRRTILKTASLSAFSSVIPSFSIAQVDLKSSTIRTVSDGAITLPASLTFETMPQNKLEPILGEFNLSKNELIRECNVTLFENNSYKVLFDAGAGTDFLSGMGQLVDNLNAVNIRPEDITDVIFTHSHPDHLWGILDDFEDLTFQNANFHIGRKEWEFWTDPDTVNKVREDRITTAIGAKRRLEALGTNINLFENDDKILPGIKALITPGHTPGHMSFEVGDNSKKFLIAGDALNNHHVAFRHPERMGGLDQDPKLAAQTRQFLLQKLTSENMGLVGFHLPNGGIGKVEETSEGYEFMEL